MRRVVIVGRGGAGKSTLAADLGRRLGLPVRELDAHFWSADLVATPPEAWERVQREWAAADRWIMDGDLGPRDVLAPRLRRADTVVLVDPGLARCAWRAWRRSPEHADFWWWLLTWGRRGRPRVLRAIREHARHAVLYRITSPRERAALLRDAGAQPAP